MTKRMKWQDIAPPIPKGDPMPMTEEYFRKHQAMAHDLIDKQRIEISKLKQRVNNLELKNKSMTGKKLIRQIITRLNYKGDVYFVGHIVKEIESLTSDELLALIGGKAK
jgi:hypothetical protein